MGERLRRLAYWVAPMWMARRDLVAALEVSATRKVVRGEPLHEAEAAVVVTALQRIRVDRPGAQAAMEKALARLRQPQPERLQG